jgi:hypothetical protein
MFADDVFSSDSLLKLKEEKSLQFDYGYKETNSNHNKTTVDFVLENVNKK